MKPLRRWQQEAMLKWDNHRGRVNLIRAVMGAGKTQLGVALAREQLQGDEVKQVVVLVPSRKLRRDWVAAMRDSDIALASDLTREAMQRRMLAGDPVLGPTQDGEHVRGAVLTYQSLAQITDEIRGVCLGRPTLVIWDEPHHAADEEPWGQRAQVATEPAVRHVFLSATPYRSDRQRIALLDYDAAGNAVELYSLSYRDALRYARLDPPEDLVRPVEFHPFDGDIEWFDGLRSEDVRVALTEPTVDRAVKSKRLRYALRPEADFLVLMLEAAHRQLMEVRQTHPNAGGIVWAIDTVHADALAARLSRVIGRRPRIVHQHAGLDDAADEIERFAAGDEPWIVVVQMVSEGVDIPRLRVGVIACVQRTKLRFSQDVGRVMRWQSPELDGPPSEDSQLAHIFVPQDEPMMEMVRAFEDELREAIEETDEEVEQHQRDRAEQLELPFDVFIGATGREGEPLMGEYSREAVDHDWATAWARQYGGTLDEALELAHRLRIFGMPNGPQAEQSQPEPFEKRKARARRDLDNLVKQCARVESGIHRPGPGGWSPEYQKAVKRCWAEVKTDLLDGRTPEDCDLPELEHAAQVVREWIRVTSGAR